MLDASFSQFDPAELDLFPPRFLFLGPSDSTPLAPLKNETEQHTSR